MTSPAPVELEKMMEIRSCLINYRPNTLFCPLLLLSRHVVSDYTRSDYAPSYPTDYRPLREQTG